MRKIAFTNQKGGVGKSTSCINIAAILGVMGKKVLVIDLDPQANTTMGFGIDLESLQDKTTVYECITGEVPGDKAIINTKFDNVSIIPSFITLANAEIEISSKMGRETLLKDCIEDAKLDEMFDYILFDLPPTLGLLTINGLVAADEIVIPVDAGVFAMSGIEQLVNIISLIKKKFNPKLDILGVLMTKVDSRTKMSKDLFNDLRELFGAKLFDTVIHQNVKIAEAQKEQSPINYFDRNSKGTIEYGQVTEEIVRRA